MENNEIITCDDCGTCEGVEANSEYTDLLLCFECATNRYDQHVEADFRWAM
jgi:hypothetical protein